MTAEVMNQALELVRTKSNNQNLIQEMEKFVMVGLNLPEGLEGSTKEEVISNYLSKSNRHGWNTPLDALRYACLQGDLKIAKWIHETFGLGPKDARACGNLALRNAAQNGHLEVLQWLHDTYGLGPEDARACDNMALQFAARNGHLEVLQWLHDTYGLTAEDARAKDNYALRFAAENGHLDVLKYLIKVFDILTPDDITTWDKNQSEIWQEHWNKDVVEYLQAEIFQKNLPKGLEGSTKEEVISDYLCGCEGLDWSLSTEKQAFRHACRQKDLEIAKWLHETFELGPEDARRGFHSAVKNGNLEILQWLHATYGLEEEDARREFHSAVKNGNLEILQWLHATYGLGAEDARADDNWALRYAATNGRFYILQWLHDTYGLTAEDARADDNWALRNAARKGHLEVLQCLHETYGLTAEDVRTWDNWALRYAALNGHLHVVKYLVDTFDILTPDDIASWESCSNASSTCCAGGRGICVSCILVLCFDDIASWDKDMPTNWQERWPKEVVEYLQAEIAKRDPQGTEKISVNDTLPEGLEGDTLEEVIKNYVNNSYPLHNQRIQALMCAGTKGELEILKWFILELKPTVEEFTMPLRSASANGHMNIVRYLINQYGDQLLTLPNIVTWNTGCTGIWQNRWPKKAVEYLEEELAKREPIDCYTFDIDVQALRQKRVQAILDQIVKEMNEEGTCHVEITVDINLRPIVAKVAKSKGLNVKVGKIYMTFSL